MDPVTLMIIAGLLGGGGAATQEIPNIVVNKYDKYNKERLAELEALKEGRGLGLSGATKSQIRSEFVEPTLRTLTNQQIAPTSGLMGGDVGTDIARGIAQNAARGQAVGQLQGQAALQVRAADEAKREKQLAEIDERTAYQAARRTEQLQGILNIIYGTGEAVAGEQGFGNLTGPAPEAGTPEPSVLSRKMTNLGPAQDIVYPFGELPPELQNLAQTDPEFAAYLSTMGVA